MTRRSSWREVLAGQMGALELVDVPLDECVDRAAWSIATTSTRRRTDSQAGDDECLHGTAQFNGLAALFDAAETRTAINESPACARC